MATINGITSAPATRIEAKVAADHLANVLDAIASGQVSEQDCADYLTHLETAPRVSMMSDDEYEAEVAMSIAVWTAKIAVMARAA